MSVHFHRYFISLAENLIQMKSTSDDVKALNDLNEINYTLANTQPPQEFVQRAKELDKRINDDYPEIIQMYNAAHQMGKNVSPQLPKYQSDYEIAISNLKSDIYGILFVTLFKHEKVKCFEDFIERVD